jgi:transglutaminase-like putative cysteine protease
MAILKRCYVGEAASKLRNGPGFRSGGRFSAGPPPWCEMHSQCKKRLHAMLNKCKVRDGRASAVRRRSSKRLIPELMKYDILHRTRYVYSTPVNDRFNDVHLEPSTNLEQTVESFSLRLLPGAPAGRYFDFYGNWVHHFEIPESHLYLLIESQARVKTHPIPPLAAGARPFALARIGAALDKESWHDFLQGSRYVEIEVEPWRLAIDATVGQSDAWQAALAIMNFVHGYLKYEPQSTHVHTHMRDVIKERRGVCQDYAHLMIGLCRSLKIPARYVSGYLATEIASPMHAWVEVFIPGCGWQALDPTHNRQVDETCVKIGIGRDYADVPPVAGSYRGTLQRTMEEEVRITPAD